MARAAGGRGLRLLRQIAAPSQPVSREGVPDGTTGQLGVLLGDAQGKQVESEQN